MLQRRLSYSLLAIALTIVLGVVVNQSIGNSRVPVTANRPAIVQLEQPFQLKVAQVAQISSENVQLKFLEVQQDSRCPVNVQCIWQGQAKIAVSLTKNEKNLGNLTLETSLDDKPIAKSLDGYSIKLIKVTPRPKTNKPIAQSDYNATFILTHQ
jgi:hypothetical protein